MMKISSLSVTGIRLSVRGLDTVVLRLVVW